MSAPSGNGGPCAATPVGKDVKPFEVELLSQGRVAEVDHARTRKPAATTSSDAPTGEGVREQLQRILNPLELVVLTRDRVQGALDEAVERGRMTRQDASDLAAELLSRGRRQTDDLLAELEGLLGRSLGSPADRVIREVDRARRAAGLGPSFPIVGYDDLTAAQVQAASAT